MTSDLAKAKQTVSKMQEQENALKEQLNAEKKKKKEVTTETMTPMDKRPAALVRKYGELYAQMRLDTLDSLDKLTELNNNDDLKNKLLFSVIVASDAFIAIF